MKTYLLYGFLLALSGFLLTLVLFICGLQSDAAKLMSTRWVGSSLSLIIAIAFLVLAIRARRNAVPPSEDFGYGWALWAGVATQLFASFFSMITTYLYAAVINPGLTDLMLQAQAEKMQAMGREMTDAQQAMMRHFIGPVGQAILAFFATLFIGVIIALIAAAFLRRTAERDPNAI